MTTNQAASRLTFVELTVAGALMVLAGATVVAFAFASPPDSSLVVTPSTIGTSALGLVLVAAGIESIRRRHFWFALAAAIVMVLANLAYVLATGQWAAVGGVVTALAVVVLIGSRRSAFRS